MIIIPAIDLRGGRVVRLEQGDYERETRYQEDPIELALRYQKAGATCLHLVDLDSARDGGEANLKIIHAICGAVDIPVQTGGGVRCLEDLTQRLEAGAKRVVVGSLCVKRPEVVCSWLDSLGGDCLVAGLDVSRGVDEAWFPHASGWSEAGDTDLFTLLSRFSAAGLVHLLCTDIERDGMYLGPSITLYQSIANEFPALKIQASGGIGSPDDLESVSRTGVDGCIVGRALLEGRVPLKEIERWSR